MRKVLCALLAVLAVCGGAFAAESESRDVAVDIVSSFTLQRDLGNAVGFRTLEGLHVVWMGTFRNN